MKIKKNQLEKNSNEWSSKNNFNPFNSSKLLAHLERWRFIKKGQSIPPPVLVTIDPANMCNYNCVWCNSKPVIHSEATLLSKVALKRIVSILQHWGCSNNKYKVKAVCIAGGGEPLLNDNTGFLINNLVASHIDVGVVTNGRLIDKFIEPLSKCHWVSVSVDSGTAKTFSKLKNTDINQFDQVIKNIRLLVEYSKKNNTYLASSPLSFGVTYKFLVHKDNINEIEIAAKIAKSIGCKSMHIRPVGKAWHESRPTVFSKEQIKMFHEKIVAARKLEDENFSVYGITHKFTDNFQPNNNFFKCHAIFMTTVFMPPRRGDHVDSFILSQCCDRRGDLNVELGHNLKNISDVTKKWGCDDHWKMQDKINLKQCPRCTYSPHNKIYEEVICDDNMSINFI